MSLRPVSLTCEHRTDPRGLDVHKPRLGWRLAVGSQVAYRVLVASSPALLVRGRGDCWDSGKVSSADSVDVAYAGRPLRARETCVWMVKVWDARGRATPWSAPARWEMALLAERDWIAKWICPPQAFWTEAHGPAPYVRREFTLDDRVVRARAYVCGPGYFELNVNGRRVGDQVLAPNVTHYDRTLLYLTLDVTRHLRRGRNAIGVLLGNGWFNQSTDDAWNLNRPPWRCPPKLLLQLHVELADGRELVVASGPDWRTGPSPLLYNSLRNGETYDARAEKPGWDRPGFDDAAWMPVMVSHDPGGRLRAESMPPMRVIRTFKPSAVTRAAAGGWLIAFPQNLSGWARLRLRGVAGQKVTLQYGERLGAGGLLERTNIAQFVKTGEFQTDHYHFKGQGLETWEPRFTYHGFQYVHMTGYDGPLEPGAVTARVVHTDLGERGQFSCSNRLLNRIQHAARWSTLCNYHGIPTDCPHREKNGWTGDAHLSSDQALLNFEIQTSYAKWLHDIVDAQRPGGQIPGIVPSGGWGYCIGPSWDSVLIYLPWNLYVYGGDRQVLATHYEAMGRLMAFFERLSVNGITDYGLGDWCPPTGGAAAYRCPVALLSTAQVYTCARLMARIATLLGKRADARGFRRQAQCVRAAFRARFVASDGGGVDNNSQSALATALYHGLIDGTEQAAVFARLVEAVEAHQRHVDVGMFGAKYLMQVLTDGGRADLAYALATQEDFPSWGHMIRQGATTLWESWGGEDSRLHHDYTDISAWFYKALAGINPDPEQPGFKHTILRPQVVGDLKWVKAWHDSPYGRIRSEWQRSRAGVRLLVEVPPNTTASLALPGARGTLTPVGPGVHRFRVTAGARLSAASDQNPMAKGQKGRINGPI